MLHLDFKIQNRMNHSSHLSFQNPKEVPFEILDQSNTSKQPHKSPYQILWSSYQHFVAQNLCSFQNLLEIVRIHF